MLSGLLIITSTCLQLAFTNGSLPWGENFDTPGAAHRIAQKAQGKSPNVYPPEVQKAFMDECIQGGSREVCSCVLDRMQREITLEQLTKMTDGDMKKIEEYSMDCVTKHASSMSEKSTSIKPKKAGSSKGSINWGPKCVAYVQAVSDFCKKDNQVPDVYKTACDVWITGLEQMKSAVKGIDDAKMIMTYEEGCKAGFDALEQLRKTLKK